MEKPSLIKWNIIRTNPQNTLKMDFKEKLDAILRAKKITIRRLSRGVVSGLKSTIEKAYIKPHN